METNVQVLLTSDPTVAQELTKGSNPPKITIEAEYGQFVAKGTVYTAAHHQQNGPYSNKNPSPCADSNIPVIDDGVILISHMDLDTVGGCLRAIDSFEDLFTSSNEEFWEFAAHVDVKGPHMMNKFYKKDNLQDLVDKITSFWAWSAKNTPHLRTSQGEHIGVTNVVLESGNALRHILTEDPLYLVEGKNIQEKEYLLAKESFRDAFQIGTEDDKITAIIRESDSFTNHLYQYGNGEYSDIIIAYNNKHQSITLSYAQWDEREIDKLIAPAYEIMQAIWGETAGGHANIAGTPRELSVKRSAIKEVIQKLSWYRDNHLYQISSDSREIDLLNQEMPF